MNGWKWSVLAVLAISAILNIATIGKQRTPMTAEAAIGVLLINGYLAVAVVLS